MVLTILLISGSSLNNCRLEKSYAQLPDMQICLWRKYAHWITVIPHREHMIGERLPWDLTIMRNLDLKAVFNKTDSVSEYTAQVWSVRINRAISAPRLTSPCLNQALSLCYSLCIIFSSQKCHNVLSFPKAGNNFLPAWCLVLRCIYWPGPVWVCLFFLNIKIRYLDGCQ